MTMATGQKAKMLAGELYLASDPELVTDHLRAQAILARFRQCTEDLRTRAPDTGCQMAR